MVLNAYTRHSYLAHPACSHGRRKGGQAGLWPHGPSSLVHPACSHVVHRACSHGRRKGGKEALAPGF